MNIFDIDIDTQTSTDRSKFGTRAMIYNKEQQKILPHPSGIYLEPVPVDLMSGLAAFDYEYGNNVGFQKVDILHNTSYDIFNSKAELDEVLSRVDTFDWNILAKESNVLQLPHIGNHFELIQAVKPKSIEDLSDVVALIRPGKRNLLDTYLKHKHATRKQLYLRSTDGMVFKKSHATSYALMIVCVAIKKFDSGIRF
ncbi:MAG: hypothetical protein JHC38_06005 [Thiotrichales bacterium]|nr:hypothetical protein [Thiotrichales bacterium]